MRTGSGTYRTCTLRVVDAYKSFGNFPVPLIVRLQGTNAEEAKQLIDDSGLQVTSAITLQDAANRVSEAV